MFVCAYIVISSLHLLSVRVVVSSSLDDQPRQYACLHFCIFVSFVSMYVLIVFRQQVYVRKRETDEER